MRRIAWAVVMVVSVFVLTSCSDSKAPPGAASAFDPFAAGSGSASAGPVSAPAALAVGDCFNSDQFAPGLSIDPHGLHLIPCDELHQHQVYAVDGNAEASGVPFPGDEPLRAFADEVCLAAFERAIGVAYLQSTLDFATIKPDAAAWKAGDRAVICAVHDVEFNELQGTRLATTTTSLSSESG
ncbi:MAG: hypothetical protein QOD92_1352 [Acidimicrobiaceae bacterium]|jgi:hypothetical protein